MAKFPPSSKLSISSHQSAVDSKDREFFDSLTDEEKKKFALYVVMKYAANVEGSSDLQNYYLYAVNEHVNKNFFDLSKHPKLQWLLLTTVSPNIGKQRHFWMQAKKADSANNSAMKVLRKIYPTKKSDELELLAEITSKEELALMMEEFGFDKKDMK